MIRNAIIGADWYIASYVRQDPSMELTSLADASPKTPDVEKVDILEPDALIKFLKNFNVQRVAHLVNYVNKDDPEKEQRVMVDWLRNVLDACEEVNVWKVVLPITREVYSQKKWQEPTLARICQSVDPIRGIVKEYRKKRRSIDTLTLPQVFSQDERNPIGWPKLISSLIETLKNQRPTTQQSAWLSIPYTYVWDVATQIAELLTWEIKWTWQNYYFEGITVTPEGILEEAKKMWYNVSQVDLGEATRTYDFRLPENPGIELPQKVFTIRQLLEKYGLEEQ